MIHDEICTYEVAKLAKEKGFDEATYYTYDEESKRLNRSAIVLSVTFA